MIFLSFLCFLSVLCNISFAADVEYQNRRESFWRSFRKQYSIPQEQELELNPCFYQGKLVDKQPFSEEEIKQLKHNWTSINFKKRPDAKEEIFRLFCRIMAYGEFSEPVSLGFYIIPLQYAEQHLEGKLKNALVKKVINVLGEDNINPDVIFPFYELLTKIKITDEAILEQLNQFILKLSVH